MLTWSACIATLDRQDVLMVALAHVLRQTRPPHQIVVVDASDNWEEGRARAESLVADRTDIELIYVTSPVRSSATQRNLGISMCESDIVFLMDDDSFLHDTCAEELLRVYDADRDEAVAGVGALLTDENPSVDDSTSANGGSGLARKKTGQSFVDRMSRTVRRTALGRWINRTVMFQNAETLFLRYDEPRERVVPPSVAHLKVKATPFMPGSGMSFRRSIAEVEKFDTALRYYAAFEDLDIGYRIARHGAILRAGGARLHHFEAAAGRIKRQKVIVFQLLNMVVFLKRHAKNPDAFQGAYRIMLMRRLLSEFLKDGLSRRWDFPQLAGVLVAMRHWREVWSRPANEIDSWYPDFQKRILEDMK
jgi:GT2 family glycosyltransferase